MNVLVTGGAGYIGSVLTRYLLSKGHRVSVLDNLTYSDAGLIANIGSENFQFWNGDIRSRSDCKDACKKQDVVIHLAAIVGEPACDKNIEARGINVFGTRVLYEAARARNVQSFVFASTCSNYGQAEQAAENAQLKPLGLYAETKVECEKWLLEQKAPMITTILRFATAFGLSPRMRFDLLINQLVLDAWENGDVEIYNKHSWRPFCHVEDISRAINVVINSCPRLTDRQVYNVGGFNVTKEMLCSQLSVVFPELYVTYKKTGKGRNYSVDFGRINRLGFRAEKHTGYGIIEVADALKLGLFENPRKMTNGYSSHRTVLWQRGSTRSL